MVVLVVIVIFLPEEMKDTIFSEAGVAVVGILFPALESVRAVLTEDSGDDTRWLMYWCAWGVLMVLTENLEIVVLHISHQVTDAWWICCFSLLLWLQLPFTDGATLCYDYITKPFLIPLIKPFAKKITDGSIINKITVWAVNGSHLYMLYFVFIMLPGAVERFICVMVGATYPVIASMVAITTEDTAAVADDTTWLLYWSVFACLHLVMCVTEDILAWIPGFYSIMLMGTVYLLLPMFNGADQVFRRVLVPLFNLRREMIKRDARMLMTEVTRKLPESHRASFSAELATIFQMGAEGKKTN